MITQLSIIDLRQPRYRIENLSDLIFSISFKKVGVFKSNSADDN